MSEPSTSYGSRPAPTASSFELFAWIFMRVSGVLLLFLALGHLVIMHLINNVGNINYEFVAGRWSGELGLFWRGYDWLMLTLAMLHGVNGLRTIFDDYLRPGRIRTLVLASVYLVSAGLFIVGSVVIFMFKRVM
jgi:succinate dehydrogenase / fumarate reductase membrane anchor subunit